jgi:hypothetical protein
MNYALLIYGDEKKWEAADATTRNEIYAACSASTATR